MRSCIQGKCTYILNSLKTAVERFTPVEQRLSITIFYMIHFYGICLSFNLFVFRFLYFHLYVNVCYKLSFAADDPVVLQVL